MKKTFILLLVAVFAIAVPVSCRKNEKSATSAVQKKPTPCRHHKTVST